MGRQSTSNSEGGGEAAVAARRKSENVRAITIEIPGPVEPVDREASWDWPDWPNGPVGASQTGMRGGGLRQTPGDAGVNPMYYSFATSRTLLQAMRDPPPEGRGAPVYPVRYPVSDEGVMARNVKANARYFGADLVGIVKLTPERIRLAAYRQEQEAVSRFTYYIIVAKEMEALHFRSRLIHPNFPRPVRSPSASGDVHKSYSDVEKVCVHLADYIRGLGYNAESQGPSRRLLNGPFANWAGLGETGRNNVVITPQFGPRVRLGGVLTDLPLAEDVPTDIGVQAFCEICMKCVRACPVGALSSRPKQLIRGVLRWPHHRQRCSDLGWAFGGSVSYGCQQCLIVCPYNKPPGVLHDTVRWFLRHAPWMDRFFLIMDGLFPSSHEQYMDYEGYEEGDRATMGLWLQLWHEKGWIDGHTPPPRPQRRPDARSGPDTKTGGE